MLMAATFVVPAAADSHVSVAGKDSWPGTEARPFATLGRAVDATRAVHPKDRKRVIVHGGKYYGVAVTLCPDDSGLTIEAAPGEQPILYGGTLITGWHGEGDGWAAADLPAVQSGRSDFRHLVVNDRFAPRARWPKDGTFSHLNEFGGRFPGEATGWQPPPRELELTTMKYRRGTSGCGWT